MAIPDDNLINHDLFNYPRTLPELAKHLQEYEGWSVMVPPPVEGHSGPFQVILTQDSDAVRFGAIFLPYGDNKWRLDDQIIKLSIGADG